MQAIKRRSSAAGHARGKLAVGVGGAEYARRVSFYELPPSDTVTLDEFEHFAFERLRGAPPPARWRRPNPFSFLVFFFSLRFFFSSVDFAPKMRARARARAAQC